MIRFSGESLFERISKRLERTTNKQFLPVSQIIYLFSKLFIKGLHLFFLYAYLYVSSTRLKTGLSECGLLMMFTASICKNSSAFSAPAFHSFQGEIEWQINS